MNQAFKTDKNPLEWLLGGCSWEIVNRKRAEEDLVRLNKSSNSGSETVRRSRSAKQRNSNARTGFVERELRMVELKRKIRKLEEENS